MDSCITQLKVQGPSRTCNESNEEEEGPEVRVGVALEARPEEVVLGHLSDPCRDAHLPS